MSTDETHEQLETIKHVYASIRNQSLATKTQRFQLYYWKALVLFGIFGWYLSYYSPSGAKPACQSAPNHHAALFVAIAVLALVVLFDASIVSRSAAIHRDGQLLRGLEDYMSARCSIHGVPLPEVFYERAQGNVAYHMRRNRLLESLSQWFLSQLAIGGAAWISWYCLMHLGMHISLAAAATFALTLTFSVLDTWICYADWIKKHSKRLTVSCWLIAILAWGSWASGVWVTRYVTTLLCCLVGVGAFCVVQVWFGLRAVNTGNEPELPPSARLILALRATAYLLTRSLPVQLSTAIGLPVLLLWYCLRCPHKLQAFACALTVMAVVEGIFAIHLLAMSLTRASGPHREDRKVEAFVTSNERRSTEKTSQLQEVLRAWTKRAKS